MSGGTQTVVRDGRRTARQPTGNVMNSTALQGANMAFNTYTTQRASALSTQKSKETMLATQKTDSSHSTRDADEPEPVSEMPEAGLVKDRIRTFSGHGAVRPNLRTQRSADISSSDSPQMQAATLAAMRSASRTPQAAPSPQFVTPIRKAVTGNTSSLKKPVSPAPKPDFLSVRGSRPVYAPSPVRKGPAVAQSLANIIDDRGATRGRLQSRQAGLPTITTSEKTERKPPVITNLVHSSPERGLSTPPRTQPITSESKQTISRPAPPNPKPKSTTSNIEDRSPRPKLPKKRVSRLAKDAHTSSSQEPGDSIQTARGTSQSDTATINSSYTQSTSDEALSSSSVQNTPNRQDPASAEGTSGMTKEALADAIIASSLASSRAPSPYSAPPPLPPPRRSRSRSLLHPGDILKKDTRSTPSPPKGLRQTLRDPPKSDVEEGKTSGRRHLIRHHPHKHHEGDRRRWRQEVTEVARKRYEGVWAANKGLWVPSEGMIHQIYPGLPRTLVASDLVVHLVVRDIWLRSRLPAHTLEQIWDLVDRSEIGMLSREEFVVGLWLIDETLRGHKIPVKVPDSVWDSVRHLPGIKIPQDF